MEGKEGGKEMKNEKKGKKMEKRKKGMKNQKKSKKIGEKSVIPASHLHNFTIPGKSLHDERDCESIEHRAERHDNKRDSARENPVRIRKIR